MKTIADVLSAPHVPGMVLSPAFVLDRPTRERLVIFDPASAPLLRPLLVAANLRPWHASPPEHWAIAIPAGYTAGLAAGAGALADFAALAARHPALARYLQAHTAHEPDRRAGIWWELPVPPATPPGPRIVLGPGVAAWDESAALLAAPLLGLPGADPYALALLWARIQQGRAAEAALDTPLPDVPAAQQANLAGLALSATALAGQLAEHERATLRRLLADFAPPGATATARLARWWELDFPELRAELRDQLGNDIPERFRPTWEQIHAQQRADHARAAEQLAQIERAIAGQLAGL